MSKKYKYNYTICTSADEEVYHRQCMALEKHIPELRKMDELQDVDSSLIQRYMYGDNVICVINDCDAGFVDVKSDIPLEPFFERKDKKASVQVGDVFMPVPETA